MRKKDKDRPGAWTKLIPELLDNQDFLPVAVRCGEANTPTRGQTPVLGARS